MPFCPVRPTTGRQRCHPWIAVWERTRGSANEVKAVGTVSNGAMTLYTINPNIKTLADFSEQDRIAVPTVRLSFNAMMLQMAAEQVWGDPHRLDHLTVALGHPDAVTALSAGYGKATVTAHIAVQPCTDRGLKLPGAHVITDGRKVFGGPLTQITLLATEQTKEKNPTPFQAVANALEAAIEVANADKRKAAGLWKEVQKAPEAIDDLLMQLNDPGFEFTSRPQRIGPFMAFLNRVGTLKTKVGDWKELLLRDRASPGRQLSRWRTSPFFASPFFALKDSRSTNSWRNPMPERIVAVKNGAF